MVAAEERKEESSGSGGSYREREPIDLGERGRRGIGCGCGSCCIITSSL